MQQKHNDSQESNAIAPSVDDNKVQQMSSSVAPNQTKQSGFLPIKTNTFDRVFISVVCFVAIHLLWMRFVEAFIPLFVATVISLILAVIIVRRG